MPFPDPSEDAQALAELEAAGQRFFQNETSRYQIGCWVFFILFGFGALFIYISNDGHVPPALTALAWTSAVLSFLALWAILRFPRRRNIRFARQDVAEIEKRFSLSRERSRELLKTSPDQKARAESFLAAVWGDLKTAPANPPAPQPAPAPARCEHDWKPVMRTSGNTLAVVTQCTKCGEVMRPTGPVDVVDLR